MADHFTANPGAGGDTFAADDVAGVKYPISKLDIGGDGVSSPVSAANPLPVSATDLPLPTGAATEATLEALRAAAIKMEDGPHTSGDSGVMSLAVRQDAEQAIGADGDYAPLQVNAVGRLKVSAQPAFYALVTGSITANAQSVSCQVDRSSNVMIYMLATTLVGHNAIFEGSLDSTNGTNGTWFGIQVIRSNANIIEAATGVLAATPVYAWEASVNGLAYMRVRATTHTSGTAAYQIQRGSYATEPIPGAQVSATQPVSGSVTVTAGTINPVVPATPYILNSLATTNIALILTGTSGLQAFYATNTGATGAYVKLYNKATTPVLASDVPAMILFVPAVVGGAPGVCTLPIGFSGFRFSLGLGIAVTGAVADTDATAVAASQVKVILSRTV